MTDSEASSRGSRMAEWAYYISVDAFLKSHAHAAASG